MPVVEILSGDGYRSRLIKPGVHASECVQVMMFEIRCSRVVSKKVVPPVLLINMIKVFTSVYWKSSGEKHSAIDVVQSSAFRISHY